MCIAITLILMDIMLILIIVQDKTKFLCYIRVNAYLTVISFIVMSLIDMTSNATE